MKRDALHGRVRRLVDEVDRRIALERERLRRLRRHADRRRPGCQGPGVLAVRKVEHRSPDDGHLAHGVGDGGAWGSQADAEVGAQRAGRRPEFRRDEERAVARVGGGCREGAKARSLESDQDVPALGVVDTRQLDAARSPVDQGDAAVGIDSRPRHEDVRLGSEAQHPVVSAIVVDIVESGRRRLIGKRIEEAREVHNGETASANLDVRPLRVDIELDAIRLARKRDPGHDARPAAMGEVGQRAQVDDVELAAGDVLRSAAGAVGERPARHHRQIEQLVGRLHRIVVGVLGDSYTAVPVDVIDEVGPCRDPEGRPGQGDRGNAPEVGGEHAEPERRRRPCLLDALGRHHQALDDRQVKEIASHNAIRRPARRGVTWSVKALGEVDLLDSYRNREHVCIERCVGAVGVP